VINFLLIKENPPPFSQDHSVFDNALKTFHEFYPVSINIRIYSIKLILKFFCAHQNFILPIINGKTPHVSINKRKSSNRSNSE